MKRIMLAVLLAVMTGCSPEIQVYTDYDPDYDLWNYSTFDWTQKTNIEEGKNPIYYNELNDKRIKSAAKEELFERGYLFTENNPQMKVHYHILVEDQPSVIRDQSGFYYDPYWFCMLTNMPQYQEGTLILDLMDAETNQIIWRGWAVSIITVGTPPEEIELLIKKAIEKIFRKFPEVTHPTPSVVNITN